MPAVYHSTRREWEGAEAGQVAIVTGALIACGFIVASSSPTAHQDMLSEPELVLEPDIALNNLCRTSMIHLHFYIISFFSDSFVYIALHILF